jgi:hypothetical protein
MNSSANKAFKPQGGIPWKLVICAAVLLPIVVVVYWPEGKELERPQPEHTQGKGSWLIYNGTGVAIGTLELGGGRLSFKSTTDKPVSANCTVVIEPGQIRVVTTQAVSVLGKAFVLSEVTPSIWSIKGGESGLTAHAEIPAATSP